MQKSTKGRPKIHGDVMLAVERLAMEGLGGSQIFEKLKEDPKLAKLLPSLRTIQTYAAKLAPPGPNDPWTLADDEPEDPRPVLAAVAAAIEVTEGRITSVSRLEAHLICRILQAMPELEPGEVWRLGRLYASRLNRKESTEDLDALFAFSPRHPRPSSPEGLERQRRYYRAVGEGWIPAAASFAAVGTDDEEAIDKYELLVNRAAQMIARVPRKSPRPDDDSLETWNKVASCEGLVPIRDVDR